MTAAQKKAAKARFKRDGGIGKKKKGTTKQARKKYKLTTAGVRAVEAMLAPSEAGEE